MTHGGGGGGVCVREWPPIKVEWLAPGAAGRERAPAPLPGRGSRSAPPGPASRRPPRAGSGVLPGPPRSQAGATGERPEGGVGEGPEGGAAGATASGKPEGGS